MITGWSPLPFALRLQSINRAQKAHTSSIQSAMVRDIQNTIQQQQQQQQQPPPPIQPLNHPTIQPPRPRRKNLLKLPPPNKQLQGGLAAYTEILWPPDRKRRKQHRRKRIQPTISKPETTSKPSKPSYRITAKEIQQITKKNRTSFLWLPYFRKGIGFTEDGCHAAASRQMYDTYVNQYTFAFNNAGTYYIEGANPNRRFYGVALDFDQARHRLIDLMRQERAPPRLQEIFDQTSDERDLLFKIVQRISPFQKRKVHQTTVRVPITFDAYRIELFTQLKSLILQYNIGNVHKSKIFPVIWKQWLTHVKDENLARYNAALRIQGSWRRRQGSFALHLKRVARKQFLLEQQEEKEMNDAARRIQGMWRIRQGGLAVHLKRQHKIQTEREDAAIRRIQHWYSIKSGSFSAKMKARAQMQMIKEEQEQDKAVRLLQMWWSRMNGSFAAKLKARAQIHLMQEEKEMELAALKIQVAWRRRQGNLGEHMKRQAQKYADEQDEIELLAVLRLQVYYRRKHGKLAYHMANSQRRQAEEDAKRLEQAAVYVQYRWRVSKGMLAQHLIRQARKRVKRRRTFRKTETFRYEYTETRASAWNELLWSEGQDPVDASNWMKCWDEGYGCEYWHNKDTGESVWEDPMSNY